jgi:phospholipid/cholesterol/gamma-HCH transport system ATP-binding protein
MENGLEEVPQTAIKDKSKGRQVVLSVRDLTVGFGDKLVLDHLNLDIYRGEILGFVGASGTGKSVLIAHRSQPSAAPFRHDPHSRR